MSLRKDRILFFVVPVVCMLLLATAGLVSAKSLYVVANHHTGQFDAYDIKAPGVSPPIAYQARYGLTHADDPADVGVWMDVGSDPPEGALFITSEFDAGVELVDAKTMTSLGWVDGAQDLAGIDVDDVNNVIYTVDRATNDLYVYDWDPVARTLALRAGFPIDLPNCNSSGAWGLALDEISGYFYVADARSGRVRQYDATTFVEVDSWAPSIPPIGIAVDRTRGYVYTTHPDGWCAYVPQSGNYTLLSRYNVATGVETTVNMGHGGMGIAVDEVTGFVYVTGGCSGDDISVWDSTMNFVYSTGDVGNPAGIGIGNLSYNPLNLAKNDNVVGHGVYIGQTFTYEITCDNLDNDASDVTGVVITDDLPVELDFVSEKMDGVAGSGVYDATEHTVTWNVGTIPAGMAGPFIELIVQINDNAQPNTTIYNYCSIVSDQTGETTVIGDDPDDQSPEEPGTYINPTIPVAFDVKPTSCPNPLNTSKAAADEVEMDPGTVHNYVLPTETDFADKRPILPTAILGTADFDVTKIDPETIRLMGVPAKRWSLEDVATPVGEEVPDCHCITDGPDGLTDLTVKFDKDDLVAALGEVYDRDTIPVTVTGELHDGTPFTGTDCVIILGGTDREGDSFEGGAAALLGNYPNPFNPSTVIAFTLQEPTRVELTVFNVTGQVVTQLVDDYLEAGEHRISWDGSGLSSGVYLYRLQAGEYRATRKMLLVR